MAFFETAVQHERELRRLLALRGERFQKFEQRAGDAFHIERQCDDDAAVRHERFACGVPLRTVRKRIEFVGGFRFFQPLGERLQNLVRVAELLSARASVDDDDVLDLREVVRCFGLCDFVRRLDLLSCAA